MAGEPENQRITRLTPLADVIAAIDAVTGPVAPREMAGYKASGHILAEDAVVSSALPSAALALRDGWAIRSELTADAGAYAPAPLAGPRRVNVGERMPSGTDAVAPHDGVMVRSGQVLALTPVTSGDGVLSAAGDFAAGAVLLRAGCRITEVHARIFAAAGIEKVSVRQPNIRIGVARRSPNATIESIVSIVSAGIAGEGGTALMLGTETSLSDALSDEGFDAVLLIGGTGSGDNDTTVRTLAEAGEVRMHGIALHPGETAAFGVAAGRPVLALPGRLDAALAVWHVLGGHLMARLTGRREPLATRTAKLTHKIASTVGVSELIPVRCDGASATLIASGYVPLSGLAQAQGWILVPPSSEGFPAGSEVVIRPFP